MCLSDGTGDMQDVIKKVQVSVHRSTREWIKRTKNEKDSGRASMSAAKYRRIIGFWEACKEPVDQEKLVKMLGVCSRTVRRMGYTLEAAGLVRIIYVPSERVNGTFVTGPSTQYVRQA